MSKDEATLLLQSHGVSEVKTREWLVSITRAHPQALVLASRLTDVLDMDELKLPSQSSAVYEELCTEILLRSVLKHEKDVLIRRALTTIPILRFFTAREVSKLLQCSADETEYIITVLKGAGFLEITGKTLKYHDLLRDLTLKFIEISKGEEELRALHLRAASAFDQSPESPEPLTLVEPFYHFLNGNLSQAVVYSERHIKPALDRKERTLAAVLINQIDFSALPDNAYKGWLLLRYGGYFREFRSFSKAVEIFEKIFPIVENDERLLASVLNNLGWVYLYWNRGGHIERALTFFEESNNICRKNDYVGILAMNLNNMGIAHSRLRGNDAQIELDCYEQCLAITESEESRNYLVSGMALQNIGLVYHRRCDYQRAFRVLSQALERFRACHCPQRESEIVYLLACTLFDSKEYTKARDFLDASLRTMQSRPERDPYYLAEIFFTLAKVLERLGEHNNMRKCLFSGMVVSLLENVDYHILAAQKTAQFCRYLFAIYGGNFALATLEYIADNWSNSDFGEAIPQFSDYILSEADNMSKQSFWANGQSPVSHAPMSRCCKPRRWERVVLRSKSRDRLCKNCEAMGPIDTK